jgi:hypothetical protein
MWVEGDMMPLLDQRDLAPHEWTGVTGEQAGRVVDCRQMYDETLGEISGLIVPVPGLRLALRWR